MKNYHLNSYNISKIVKLLAICIIIGLIGILRVNALEETEIMAEISGEINNPGTYTLEKGATVADLIDEAGGVTANANTEVIFWERILTNGDSIYIYPNDETIASSSEDNEFYDEVKNTRYNNYYYNYKYTYEKNWSDEYQQVTTSEIDKVDVIENPSGTCGIETHIDGEYRLDLNVATAEQIWTQLYYYSSQYGFTEEHAQAMVDYRESKAGEPIYSLCEFVNLPNFTYEMVESMQPHVKV